jgi:hypothetical protein
MLAAVMPSFATVVFPGKEPGPAEDQTSKKIVIYSRINY